MTKIVLAWPPAQPLHLFVLLNQRQRNQRSNCQHPLDHGKSKRFPEKHLGLGRTVLMGPKEGAGACGPSEKTISNFGRV